MKKVIILLMFSGLFAACGNDNKEKDKYDRDKTSADARQKDDYRSNDKSSDSKANADNNKPAVTDENKNLGSKSNNSGWGDSGNSEGWSGSDETRFMTDCERTARKNVGATRANEYCDCMLQKLIKMYPNYADADRELSSDGGAKMDKLVDECNRQ